MADNKMQRYAEIKKQIKRLEAEANVLKEEIVDSLSEVDGNKVDTGYATFSLMADRKWEYSSEFVAKEIQVKNQLKKMKKEEEKSGKATLVKDGWKLRCQIVEE